MSGRAATTSIIEGKCALSVGDPGTPVPAGWLRVPLLEIAELGTGHTPSRGRLDYWDGGIPWIAIPDARDHHTAVITETAETVSQLGIENSAARILPTETVGLSRTASVGYVFIMGRPMATSQDFVTWTCSEAVDPRFLMYALLAEGDDIRKFGKGSTHTTIYFAEVKAFNLTLAPKPEQRRIVAKLDSLRTRSSRARNELDHIPKLIERYKQAILRAALKGALTADWRTTNKTEPVKSLLKRVPLPEQPRGGREATDSVTPGMAGLSVNHPQTDAPEGWQWTPLLRIARQETGHTPSRSHAHYWDGGIPWIGIKDANIHHGQTIMETLQTVSEDGLSNSSARLLPEGTVCLSRTASVGYVTIMGRSMATSQDFATWTCTEALLPKFLMYALMAEGDDIRRFGEGSTHTTIYFPEIRALHICLAPIDEQAEIVRRVEHALAWVEKIATEYARAEHLLPKLDQAILAKAFRGELVPQDPNDEPASALLERIKATRDGTAQPKRRRATA